MPADSAPEGATPEGGSATDSDTSRTLGVVLHSPGYLALLAIAAVIGIPVSLVAWAFLVSVHELEKLVWTTLPDSLGYDGPPVWWGIVTITLAGLLVGLVVRYFPGKGGHVPAGGFSAKPARPIDLPGVVLAALAGLGLGAVIGPEAPLLALGSGLALLSVQRVKASGKAELSAVVAAAGSAAAISAIFANPLVAAILFLEVIGLARRQAMMVLLPVLVASGIGDLIFTGMGNWTGLEIGSLTIPDLAPATLDIGDLLWSVPVAVVIAILTWLVFLAAKRTAALAAVRPVLVAVVVGLIVGVLAAAYAVVTDHSPLEIATSGQSDLATLANNPGSWTGAALLMLILCKGAGFALCLGAFRGGPIFPALFLGAAIGVLASDYLPGVGLVAGLAMGMAAAVAVTGLPVTTVLLVAIVLGSASVGVMPVIILGTVVALIVADLLSGLRPPAAAAEAAEPAPLSE